MAVIDSIKVDLEINEESLAALERLAALGAGAVRVINPQPNDKVIFLVERRLTQEARMDFERLASEHLGCKTLVVHDVSEIIHFQAPQIEVAHVA